MSKKKTVLSLMLALAMVLAGCAGGFVDHPDIMADGSEWDGSWVNMAGRLGVALPEGGFELLTTNGSLENMSIQYATWVRGAETKIDKDTYVYDEQIYLMTEVCGTAEQAAETLEQWNAPLGEGIEAAATETVTIGGNEYTLRHYTCTGSDAHFSRGVTACWTYGDLVLVVDIACIDSLNTDLTAVMEQFIGGIHYA